MGKIFLHGRSHLRLFLLVSREQRAPMKLLPFITGKMFDTSVMILIVGLVWRAADVARLFVLVDMHFIRFTGHMGLTVGSVIGAPIPSGGWGYRR